MTAADLTETPLTETDRFEVGAEDLLAPVRAAAAAADSAESARAAERKCAEALEEIRIRIGTVLKTETVSILLGAGASVECGGVLMSAVPLPVERFLLEQGVSGEVKPRVRRWLRLFYLAARRESGSGDVPLSRETIIARWQALNGQGEEPSPLPVNLERLLSTLHQWRAALPETGGRIRLDGSPRVDASAADLDACLLEATRALARVCALPAEGRTEGLAAYQALVRKLLTRPLNLKRVNFFTLNYDNLIEQAADAHGVVLLDGFVGTAQRIFRPESYEQDLYFPAETTEGRVHRFDRVLHLYKLHGSTTWVADQPTLQNPYGVTSATFDPEASEPCLIYPTPAKYGETLGMPYSELFRRFAGTVARPQSVLFVIGYGFGDDHVNAIIRQALAVPSFTLVIVDPKPASAFVERLRELRDQRVWIVQGPRLGTLSGFVETLLPDLRDEQIRQKVLATFRALSKGPGPEEGVADGN